ncbi:MAG: TRAP transporter small permease subunit [Kiritimatiellia bacterium]
MLESCVRFIERMVRYLGYASMYLLLVILAVLMFPVFARGGDVPTIWALETAQFAVGAYYLLGAGYSLQAGAHVRMDFLYANWKPRTKAIADAITSFFVLFYLVVMLIGGWQSCAYAIVSRQINHTVWAPYMAPIKIAMEIGIFFMFLQMAVEFVKSLRLALGRPLELPATDDEEEGLFRGRAARREFWRVFAVGCAAEAVGLGLLVAALPSVTAEGGVALLLVMVGALLAVGAPVALLPVSARRFHDLDMSGWWLVAALLFSLVPGLGVFVMLGVARLFMCDGAPGTLGFGPDPKGRDLIKVFDPRLPKAPEPIAPVPVPVRPDEEHSRWLPCLVCSAVGVLLAGIGYGLSVALSNPTWFVAGASALALALAFDLRGVLCMNR